MKYTRQIQAVKHAGIIGANLERSDLRGMDLRGTNFSSANLRGADLGRADLRDCKFLSADLSRTSLHAADCRGADFSGADMTMSHLRGADFRGARFWHTLMRRVMAKNAHFGDAEFFFTDVLHSDLWGAKFTDKSGLINTDRAIFMWYLPEDGEGRVRYEPTEGYVPVSTDGLGKRSIRGNAAREPIERTV